MTAQPWSAIGQPDHRAGVKHHAGRLARRDCVACNGNVAPPREVIARSTRSSRCRRRRRPGQKASTRLDGIAGIETDVDRRDASYGVKTAKSKRGSVARGRHRGHARISQRGAAQRDRCHSRSGGSPAIRAQPENDHGFRRRLAPRAVAPCCWLRC
jgi:hypothetical protein